MNDKEFAKHLETTFAICYTVFEKNTNKEHTIVLAGLFTRIYGAIYNWDQLDSSLDKNKHYDIQYLSGYKDGLYFQLLEMEKLLKANSEWIKSLNDKYVIGFLDDIDDHLDRIMKERNEFIRLCQEYMDNNKIDKSA